MYRVAKPPSDGHKLLNFFKSGIRNKPGFHVYYMTIVGGNHVLTVVVNNMDCCKPLYEMYDQNGYNNTSNGKLSDIVDGIRKQVSWVLASTWSKRQRGFPEKIIEYKAGKLKKSQNYTGIRQTCIYGNFKQKNNVTKIGPYYENIFNII